MHFLKPHEVRWLVDAETLRLQTGLSIEQRVKHFRRQFPEAKLNCTLLSRVYRENGVKRRRIKWEKRAREQNNGNYGRDKARMIRDLKKAKRDGYRVVYIDETVFTRSTVPRTEYCLPKANVTVDKSWINEPTVAVLSGISRDKGQELFMQFPKSVNVEKF